MHGTDLPLMEDVAETAEFPVFASGGLGSLNDLRALADRGVAAAIVGMGSIQRRYGPSCSRGRIRRVAEANSATRPVSEQADRQRTELRWIADVGEPKSFHVLPRHSLHRFRRDALELVHKSIRLSIVSLV